MALTRRHRGGLSMETNVYVRGECDEDGWVPCNKKIAILSVVFGRFGLIVNKLCRVKLGGLGEELH